MRITVVHKKEGVGISKDFHHPRPKKNQPTTVPRNLLGKSWQLKMYNVNKVYRIETEAYN